jgi:ketosteroid isomerase-like protein
LEPSPANDHISPLLVGVSLHRGVGWEWENGAVSEANVEAVRQALAAVERRDLTGLLEHADPEIELHPLLSVWSRTYRGHAGIEQWYRDLGGLWREFSLDLESFQDLGEGTLIVRLHWRGLPTDGSTVLEGPAAAVFRFGGDKIVSVDVHLDEERALASVAS